MAPFKLSKNCTEVNAHIYFLIIVELRLKVVTD